MEIVFNFRRVTATFDIDPSPPYRRASSSSGRVLLQGVQETQGTIMAEHKFHRSLNITTTRPKRISNTPASFPFGDDDHCRHFLLLPVPDFARSRKLRDYFLRRRNASSKKLHRYAMVPSSLSWTPLLDPPCCYSTSIWYARYTSRMLMFPPR